MKELLSIRQRAETIVKNRQGNHHQHGRQDEACERNTGAAPSAQAKSNVSDGVAGAGSGQALAQRQRLNKVVLAQPAPFLDDDLADVCEYGESAAESGQTDFEKGKKESAKSCGARDPL